MDVYLALGSNLGDRANNLRNALAALPPAFIVDTVSLVYETAPMYMEAQPKFLNMACRAKTELLPHDALHALKLAEKSLGREATIRFGPRLIDMDILFYEDIRLDTPELVIPHPRLHERAFVLAPLADIAPDFVHPTLGVTIAQLRDSLGDDELASVVRLGDLDKIQP
jgi:2-amino-4-hydroxy-6-hydroxymethyldihydropteridine diphosphokinase